VKLAEQLAPHLTSVKGWFFMDAGDDLPDTSLANVIAYEGLLKSQRTSMNGPYLMNALQASSATPRAPRAPQRGSSTRIARSSWPRFS
jgi:hypothetical protein